MQLENFIKPLWCNWLESSAINQKGGGLSPPRGANIEVCDCVVHFLHLYSFFAKEYPKNPWIFYFTGAGGFECHRLFTV
jgi:hypothetical protein